MQFNFIDNHMSIANESVSQLVGIPCLAAASAIRCISHARGCRSYP